MIEYRKRVLYKLSIVDFEILVGLKQTPEVVAHQRGGLFSFGLGGCWNSGGISGRLQLAALSAFHPLFDFVVIPTDLAVGADYD